MVKRGLVVSILLFFCFVFFASLVSAEIISTDIQIYPEMPISNEDLSCNITAISNSSSSGIVVNYTWYRDGIFNFTGSFSLDNNTQESVSLLSTNTTENEVWVCEMTSFEENDSFSVNSSILIRGELSINSAIINWRNEQNYLQWGKLYEGRAVPEGFVYEASMGSYFGRAPFVLNQDGSDMHFIFRDGSNNLRIRQYDWSIWDEVSNQGSTGTNRGSMSIDRYGDTLIAVWGDNDGDVEPPVYSISTDGGETWTSEEFINSTYNKFGYGNTMEFKFLDDGKGIAIWKSYGSGVGWAYAYWNGTEWDHMRIVLDINTGSVGRADLAVLPGQKAFLNFQNSDNMVYSWNGTDFNESVNVDTTGNTDSHNGPTISCNRFGRCISVWTDSSNYQEYRRYDGTEWTGFEDVDIDGADTWSDSHGQEITDLELDDEGNAILIWYEDTETEVYYAIYNWTTDTWTQGGDFISEIPTSSTEYGDGPQVRLVPLVKTMSVGPINTTVYIEGSTYFTNESIDAYCSAEDLDNSTINYYYNWYRDGVLYNSGSLSGAADGSFVLVDTLNYSETDRGENWVFSCFVSDGTDTRNPVNDSFSILEPSVEVIFEKGFVLPTDDLVCNFSVFNPEQPVGLTAYYNLYKDDSLQVSGILPVNSSESYEIILDSENTRVDEVWKCSVLISDGINNGSYYNSSVYIRMKKSISEAYVTWNDANYYPIWTKILGDDFNNTIISTTRTISGGGSNLIRFVLDPSLTIGKLIYNFQSDYDNYIYDWNGTGWDNEAVIGATVEDSDTYDIARFGKTIIVIYGTGDSAVPSYKISRDDGETWSSPTLIESASGYGKFRYHSGLDFEFLTDGTGILLYKESSGTLGWIYSIWDGNSFVESGRLDSTDSGQHAKASIAPLEGGEAFVVRRGGVYLNRWNGTAFSSRVTLDSTSSGYPGGPEIECNIYGNCIIVHRDSSAEIEYLTYDGTSWSLADVDIDGSDSWSLNYENSVLDLAMDDYNNSILVWYSSDRLEIRWATYNWSTNNWTYKGVIGAANPLLSYGDGVQVELRMPFDEPPSLINSSGKDTYNEIDPLVNVTIQAYIYDQENNFDYATFQWKNQTGSWNEEVSYNETIPSFTTKINSTFIPSSEGIYTYRFLMYDSEGNMDISEEQNLTVLWDCSWSVDESLGAFAGWAGLKNLGNITLNNLGDPEYSGGCPLDFRISYNLEEERIYYDEEYLKNAVIYSLNEKESVNISIDARFLSEINQEDVLILFDEVRVRSDLRYRNTSLTLISNQEGPYIFGEVTDSPNYVYLRNQPFNFNGYIRNVMGDIILNENNTAYNVSFYWDFPEGVSATDDSKYFDNITDSIAIYLPVSASFDNLESMSPGTNTFSLNSIGYNISGDLIKNSEDLEMFKEDIEVSFMCYPVADSICVSECGNSGDPDCPVETITIETVINAGGGGGGGSSEKSFEISEDRFELVIGEKQEFPLEIENLMIYPKKNIKVTARNIGEAEIEISPSIIKNIPGKSSKEVQVTLLSKKYLVQGMYEIIFDIEGEIEKDGQLKPFREKKIMQLFLVEISKEDAQGLLNESLKILEKMQEENFSVGNANNLIRKMNSSLGILNYGGVEEEYKTLSELFEVASASKKIIEELEESISKSEYNGIDVLESKKTFFVAKSAFMRGDYYLAYQKVKEAQLTYALETKGKFNVIRFIQNEPDKALLILASFILLIFTISIITKYFVYKRRVRLLALEEKLFLELMKVVQKQCFEENKLSMGQYGEAVRQYEFKLSKAVQRRVKYESKLVNLLNFRGEKSALLHEQKRLISLIKEIQSDYMIKGKLETRIYEGMVKSYSSRLTEVEERLIYIESKKALRGKGFFKALFMGGKNETE